jgi:hypothetical protein
MSPYLYPPGTGRPSYVPAQLVPFISSPMTRKAKVDHSVPGTPGCGSLKLETVKYCHEFRGTRNRVRLRSLGQPMLKLKLKLNYNRRSVANLTWCRASFSSRWPDFCFLLDNCGFLDVWRPLLREDGSVIYSYNCFWALSEQSPCDQSIAELTTIFTVSFKTPPA